jgi:AcrR family transcriptional regulator
MLEAVKRHGWPTVTVGELVGLAGVSKSTFYEHFADKQECFFAAFDEVMAAVTQRIGRAYRSKSDFREQLYAAFQAYVDFIIEEPAGTHLTLVDSLSLGAVGVARRREAAEAFELMIRQSFKQVPERGEVSDLTVRAIVGGIQRVVFRCVRGGQTEQLRDYLKDLVNWGLSYQRPDGAAALQMPTSEAITPNPKTTDSAADEEVWDERPDSIRSRATLTQRERMVRAAAMVAAEGGYAKLSIPAITSAAGVSNQTFYEHFTGKQQAFFEALEVLGRRAVVRIAAATEAKEAWADSVSAGLAELLNFSAENPLLARLPFIEVLGAGSAGLDHVDQLMDGVTALLKSKIPPTVATPVSDVVTEAIGGGIFVVIQNEIAEGRTAALPELAREITFIALAPFGFGLELA